MSFPQFCYSNVFFVFILSLSLPFFLQKQFIWKSINEIIFYYSLYYKSKMQTTNKLSFSISGTHFSRLYTSQFRHQSQICSSHSLLIYLFTTLHLFNFQIFFCSLFTFPNTRLKLLSTACSFT